MRNCIDHQQKFNKNSRESCLAGKYLQSLGLKCSGKEWWPLLKEKKLQVGWDFDGQPQNALDHSRGTLEKYVRIHIGRTKW